MTRSARALTLAALTGAAACASSPASGSPPADAASQGGAQVGGAGPQAVGTPATGAGDANAGGLVSAGFGTLRQDDIAIKLQLSDVLVKLTPLDESVIRTLSPDSYRALRELMESRRPAITRLASQHGLLHGSAWYVSFYGLAPEAHFSPLELTVSSAGRDFRPLEVIPLTSGFGSQRLQPRETQSALYLFEDALDVNQSITVSLGGQRVSSWATTLRTIERERALIRSRSAQQRSAPAP